MPDGTVIKLGMDVNVYGQPGLEYETLSIVSAETWPDMLHTYICKVWEKGETKQNIEHAAQIKI